MLNWFRKNKGKNEEVKRVEYLEERLKGLIAELTAFKESNKEEVESLRIALKKLVDCLGLELVWCGAEGYQFHKKSEPVLTPPTKKAERYGAQRFG